jgi:hypothetical protein
VVANIDRRAISIAKLVWLLCIRCATRRRRKTVAYPFR